jgi:hypothetical protein
MEEWDKVGWLCLATTQPWSKRKLRLEDFNPIRRGERNARKASLQSHIEAMREQLPKQGERTPEESDAAFEEAYRRHYGSE